MTDDQLQKHINVNLAWTFLSIIFFVTGMILIGVSYEWSKIILGVGFTVGSILPILIAILWKSKN